MMMLTLFSVGISAATTITVGDQDGNCVQFDLSSLPTTTFAVRSVCFFLSSQLFFPFFPHPFTCNDTYNIYIYI